METDKDINRIIRYFKNQKEVSTLYVFGSLVNGGKTRESDIDIAVLIDESKLGRTTFKSLEEKYYKASPGFSMRPVDIVIMNTASPFLKHQVLKTGRILFDRNQTLRIRFTTKAIIEYLDFKPAQDVFLKAVVNRFRRASIGR